MTHEGLARAVVHALVAGTGTADIKDCEMERAMRDVYEWAHYAALLRLLMEGKLTLKYKQRGIGALMIGRMGAAAPWEA